jgi:hypothetical protein
MVKIERCKSWKEALGTRKMEAARVRGSRGCRGHSLATRCTKGTEKTVDAKGKVEGRSVERRGQLERLTRRHAEILKN